MAGGVAHNYTVVPAGQDWLVEQVDAAMGNTTVVHRVDSAHSAMLSQPQAIAEILSRRRQASLLRREFEPAAGREDGGGHPP